MVRTQIQLQDDQYRELKRWSQQRGISLSEAVRRCVAERLEREAAAPTRDQRVRAALAVCGRHVDTSQRRTRVGLDHDAVVAEAFAR